MTTPEDGSYPRPDQTKRRWTRGQVLVLWVGLIVAGLTFPIWCRPGVLFVNAAIDRWPAELTALLGLMMLVIGALAGRAAYAKFNDARVSLGRIASLTTLALVLIPPGTILLVEGIGFLFGMPRSR